jgi:voltage-gated potassium channel
VPRVGRPGLIERQMSALLRSPPRVTTAATVIVTATAMAVVVGGVLMRVLDHKEYANVWVGMWWAIQTVTTVGYGDVTPKATSGRIVAVFVMLEGIALLTVVIAGITSTFVARAQRELAAGEAAEDDAAEARVETRLDDLSARLERVESMLRELTNS